MNIKYDLCDVTSVSNGHHVLFIFKIVLADPTDMYTVVYH